MKLVRLKKNFEKRFRKPKKHELNLFKFNEEDAPLYIKCKFNRVHTDA